MRFLPGDNSPLSGDVFDTQHTACNGHQDMAIPRHRNGPRRINAWDASGLVAWSDLSCTVINHTRTAAGGSDRQPLPSRHERQVRLPGLVFDRIEGSHSPRHGIPDMDDQMIGDIRDYASDNPERVADVVQSWIHEMEQNRRQPEPAGETRES